MKKRLIKIIALGLAASLTLTSCSGSFNPLDPFGFFSNKDDEGDKKEETTTKEEENGGFLDGILGIFGNNKQTGLRESTVSKEDLLTVSEKLYNYNGSEGRYTGQWYDGHPEGEGKFFVSDVEFCDGEWVDGMPCGRVELCEPRGGGASMYYKGIYADNSPCGEGYIEYRYSDEQGWGYAEGDFSDKSSLRWYSFDADGYPVDMGIYSASGEKISYTDESKCEGIDFERPSNIPVKFLYGDSYENDVMYQYYSGKYYGQTDENGLPNGWGYYNAAPKWLSRYIGPDGDWYNEDYYEGQFGDNYTIQNFEDYFKEKGTEFHLVNLKLFGYWEHGKPVKKLFQTYYLPDTDELVEQKYYSMDENGEWYGICTEINVADSHVDSLVSVELRALAKSKCKMIVKKYDMDTDGFKNYKYDDNGYLRSGDYETVEYYEDGTVGYFYYYKYITDVKNYQNQIKKGLPLTVERFYDGDYHILNENGDVIEQGTLYKDGWWRTNEYIENLERMEARKAMYDKLCIGLFIGGLAIGVGLAIHSCKTFDKRMEEYEIARRAHDQNEYRHDELIRQAKSAASSGDTYEADRLYREASNIPIIAVPSVF